MAPTSTKNREEAREIMEKPGYGPDKRLEDQGLDPQHRHLPRSGGDPDRPAQGHLYRRRARPGRDQRTGSPRSTRKDYSIGAQPHRQRHRRSRPDTSTRTSPAARSATTPATATRICRSCSTSNRRRPIRRSARSWCGRSTRSCRRTWRGRSSFTPRRRPAGSPYVKDYHHRWSTASTTATASRTCGSTSDVPSSTAVMRARLSAASRGVRRRRQPCDAPAAAGVPHRRSGRRTSWDAI